MPKSRVKSPGEMPLPAGWDMARDFDGKFYFIDHNSHQTSWVDPRDRLTKPATFADCVGNELPIGWEQAYDPLIGIYYIDHNNQRTQIEDPHQSWRAYQEAMLRDYLSTASEELQAKKETLDLKMRRLGIAEDEYQHLNSTLNGLHTASSTSSISTTSSRYDADLLKQDVSLAKMRVLRLRHELDQIRQEVSIKQQGITTLAQVEQKLSTGSCYTVGEAQAIINELRSIQKSLQSGEKERAELMQSLARHKEDLTRLQTIENQLDGSTLSIPLEKFSTASQTDLSGELVPMGARLAEMARLRLQYDEKRKDVQQIQRRLSELEESVEPGEVESDKDRLLLFQEKEQLLRELRSICPKSRPQKEISGIQSEIQKLETDLSLAADMAKRNIADRLRLHEEKQNLLHNLRDALNSMAALERRLKSLSASTLSMSSSSSLASLSSSQASSKGSLSSLSFTDIYGTPSTQPEGVNLADLHRRVEILLQGSRSASTFASNCDACEPSTASLTVNTSLTVVPPTDDLTPMTQGSSTQLQLAANSHPSLLSLSPRSSLSSVSPPVSPYDMGPPPSYEQAFMEKQRKFVSTANSTLSYGNVEESSDASTYPEKRYEIEKTGSYSLLPPLSPISEYVPADDSNVEESPGDVPRVPGTSSGTNTRSVSAAVSDESVAGDSGVFEASNDRGNQDYGMAQETSLESAQIQLKLRYSVTDSALRVGIERARNLRFLFLPENHKICIRIALLPTIPKVPCQFCTKFVDCEDKVTIGEDFFINITLHKLFAKTLQVTVFGISTSGLENCLGCSQVSLADFKPESCATRWYNVLSLHIPTAQGMDDSLDCGKSMPNRSIARELTEKPEKLETTSINFHSKQESEVSLSNPSGRPTKEESSDESTIISSQASTLTRNNEGEGLHGENMEKWHQRAAEWRCAPEVLAESCDEDDGNLSQDEEDELKLQEEEDAGIVYEDKSTNTDSLYVQTKGSHKPKGTHQKGPIVIKRSHTFSPSAVVNRPDYMCRLNRSDSDSSMPLYKKLQPGWSDGSVDDESTSQGTSGTGKEAFLRGSLDRRSLRWKRSSSSGSLQSVPHHKPKPAAPTARTSIDLELDRQAQHCRLQALHQEISRLKLLKEELETAKAAGDSERMNHLLDDARLQELFQSLVPALDDLSSEEKESLKMEKLLKKTSKEIYKLRKSRNPRGKPDVVSFREKMAFFTHTHLSLHLENAIKEQEDASSDKAAQQQTISCPSSSGEEKLGTAPAQTIKGLKSHRIQETETAEVGRNQPLQSSAKSQPESHPNLQHRGFVTASEKPRRSIDCVVQL